MELIELTEFKRVEKISDFPEATIRKHLDWDYVRQYISDNKKSINYIEVGIAEDWPSTAVTIWNKDYGYVNAKYVVDSSNRGNPGVAVVFIDGDVVQFTCVKRAEKKKVSFFKKMFNFVYNISKM